MARGPLLLVRVLFGGHLGLPFGAEIVQMPPKVERDGLIEVPLRLRQGQHLDVPVRDVLVRLLVVKFQVHAEDAVEQLDGLLVAPALELPRRSLREDGDEALPLGFREPRRVVDDLVRREHAVGPSPLDRHVRLALRAEPALLGVRHEGAAPEKVGRVEQRQHRRRRRRHHDNVRFGRSRRFRGRRRRRVPRHVARRRLFAAARPPGRSRRRRRDGVGFGVSVFVRGLHSRVVVVRVPARRLDADALFRPPGGDARLGVVSSGRRSRRCDALGSARRSGGLFRTVCLPTIVRGVDAIIRRGCCCCLCRVCCCGETLELASFRLGSFFLLLAASFLALGGLLLFAHLAHRAVVDVDGEAEIHAGDVRRSIRVFNYIGRVRQLVQAAIGIIRPVGFVAALRLERLRGGFRAERRLEGLADGREGVLTVRPGLADDPRRDRCRPPGKAAGVFVGTPFPEERGPLRGLRQVDARDVRLGRLEAIYGVDVPREPPREVRAVGRCDRTPPVRRARRHVVRDALLAK
mmetsp:Transcript_3303/g.12712  ORF Transcript_3303/g.12712 Transcript_3303/m.12712 type:complete len:520 (+) Transcript_3303:508-2067(+)